MTQNDLNVLDPDNVHSDTKNETSDGIVMIVNTYIYKRSLVGGLLFVGVNLFENANLDRDRGEDSMK